PPAPHPPLSPPPPPLPPSPPPPVRPPPPLPPPLPAAPAPPPPLRPRRRPLSSPTAPRPPSTGPPSIPVPSPSRLTLPPPPRHLVHAGHVLRGNLLPAHRHHPGRRARRHVLACDAARHTGDLRHRHPFGVAQRGHHRAARLVDVPHHPPPHAGVLRETDAEHLGERHTRPAAHHLRDH